MHVSFSFAQDDSTKFKPILKREAVKKTAFPLTLIALGVYSREAVPLGKNDISDFRNKHFPNFHTEIDDYFQFVPAIAAYGLEFTNLESRNDLLNKTLLLAKSHMLMAAFVYPLKYGIGDARPTGANNAWPSGHTTEAFLTATFLHKEYGHESPWISILAYSCASSVAILRVMNDRHWSADVLAGAGFGILSVNLVYLAHQHKWGKKKKLE